MTDVYMSRLRLMIERRMSKTENERLTNSDKEIPTLDDNAEYWLQVYFKLEDYEAIGTIEEFKALKYKSVAKKPIRQPNHDMTYEEVLCPRCKRYVSKYTNPYCECGQKLDWEWREQNMRVIGTDKNGDEIAEVSVTELDAMFKEIRAKAIDEFAELMKEMLKDMQFAEFQGIDVCPCAKTGEECPYINQDIGCQYCAREQTVKDIDRIAEQLKAGEKNERNII